MQTILEALRGTPWWVYVLFIYLLIRGINGLKSKTMHVNKLFIVPIIFLIWSLWVLFSKFQGLVDILLFLVFTGLGGIAGFGMVRQFNVRADHKKKLIRIPGSPFILIFVLIVFAVKYFFGYMYATGRAFGSGLHALNVIVSGTITGISFGRVFAFLKKFARVKSEKLKKS